ncbi:DUF397 domain-containing protein [Streptomyces carpaticus]|uniref:DUF397 domain-containing protein n=1 Tax=Streptomyces carpaticus TaxID=285558 RepID=UPI0021FFC81C|nr:DUF397 domain-containing protein [Streptomyces carpaticus]
MVRHNLPAHRWRSSSYSADNGGQCVEVQFTEEGFLAVGDSKDRARGALVSGPGPWGNFIRAVKNARLGP